jgi:hypothetical protein
MRGGAQSHLMRCGDGHYYVVKFQNNPPHRRIRAYAFGLGRAGRFQTAAYTAERIHAKEKLKTEFAAVTDVPLVPGNKRDDFAAAALREVGIEPVAMEGFAVWAAKLKPLLH